MWVGDRERSLAPGPQGTAWGDAASRPSRQRLPCNHAPDRLQMAGPSTVQDGLVAWVLHTLRRASLGVEAGGQGSRTAARRVLGPWTRAEPGAVPGPVWAWHMGLSVSMFAQ